MALVVAQEVPTSSSMAVPHGPAGVGEARHRMRDQLRRGGVAESVIDDAVLVLSELLSNACKHGRPQRTAAISGLVTSSLAILLVAASFGAQLIYSDYYTCREDALTNAAEQSCERHLPEQLRPLLGSED